MFALGKSKIRLTPAMPMPELVLDYWIWRLKMELLNLNFSV